MKAPSISAVVIASVFAAVTLAKTTPGYSTDWLTSKSPARPAAETRIVPESNGTAATATVAQDTSTVLSSSSALSGHETLLLRALNKITGKAVQILAPVNRSVRFETLTIIARYYYSTPPSDTPETSAFLQIDDRRPDQPKRRVFSGWMFASSPGLNGLQHPLYDAWVTHCRTGTPSLEPSIVALSPVKPTSPNAGADESVPILPEGAGR